MNGWMEEGRRQGRRRQTPFCFFLSFLTTTSHTKIEEIEEDEESNCPRYMCVHKNRKKKAKPEQGHNEAIPDQHT